MPYWCSEQCSQRWEGRWGKRLPADPQTPFAVCHICDCGRPIYRHHADRTAGRRVCGLCSLREANDLIVARTEVSTGILAAVAEAMPQVREDIKTALQAAERGAAYPQVASEDPQVTRGWLSRLLGRMYGRGTPQ